MTCVILVSTVTHCMGFVTVALHALAMMQLSQTLLMSAATVLHFLLSTIVLCDHVCEKSSNSERARERKMSGIK